MIFTAVARRFRNTNTPPPNGSRFKASLHSRARLDGHQDAHLGRDLDHRAALQKTWLTAVTTSGLWWPLI
jgi:hypothetical protein